MKKTLALLASLILCSAALAGPPCIKSVEIDISFCSCCSWDVIPPTGIPTTSTYQSCYVSIMGGGGLLASTTTTNICAPGVTLQVYIQLPSPAGPGGWRVGYVTAIDFNNHPSMEPIDVPEGYAWVLIAYTAFCPPVAVTHHVCAQGIDTCQIQ